MKGYVEVVYSKADKGGKTRWYFKLKNEDRWYACGLLDPKIKKGEQIEFDFDVNGDFLNAKVETINVLSSSPEVVEGTRSFKGFAKKAGGMSKDDYWERKEQRDLETQKRIQLQASRNAAIEMASLVISAGAFKLPENQAKRHEVLAALVKEWTDRFQSETNGVGNVQPAGVQETPTKEAMPEEWE